MREIKFRAWDKENKRMLMSGIYYSLDGRIIWAGGGKFNGTLMQFTGLKDKNGKEIYEGDTVRATKERNYYSGIVRFIDGFFGLESDAGLRTLQWYHDFELEIFGNIYEKPELLK